MNVRDFLERIPGGKKPRADGINWECLCPAHGDKHQSLSVGIGGDGKIVVCCQRGCSPAAIVSAVGLTLADLFPDENGLNGTRKSGPRIVATYDYCDENGCLLYQAVRFEPKDFRQRRPATAHPRPHAKEDWHWNLTGTRRVLYRLPELLRADPSETVWICEGEKDVEALRRLGLVATTNAMGAGKWRKEYAEQLAGRRCVVLPDNDDPGRAHAQAVLATLPGARILVLPGLPEKGDVSDWLAAGGTKEKLIELAAGLGETIRPPAETKAARPDMDIPEPPPWPDPPSEAVYFGLAGEIVRLIEPQTEADPVAVLMQFLAMFGNAAGRKAYWRVENDRHYANLYLCLVGETAKGRKGTAMGRARQAFEALGDEWLKKCVTSGLSSGEGLIKAVRDPVWSRQAVKRNGQTVESEDVLTDPGVDDKRLLVVEPEFGRVLRVMEREGNTLSSRLREGWDSGNLTNMTKAGEKSTGAHLSLIAHVTQIELRRLLTDVETANGMANRILWAAVRRSKLLPFGGNPVDLGPLCGMVSAAVREAAYAEREVPFGPKAAELWNDGIYARLTGSRPGVLGAITNRAESQVRRLALIYALLDMSPEVELPHLIAALELWDYCERSCAWVFGDSLGDRVADEILSALRAAGDKGLTQNEIREVFRGHESSERMGQALALLVKAGKARFEEVKTPGRSARRWFFVGVEAARKAC